MSSTGDTPVTSGISWVGWCGCSLPTTLTLLHLGVALEAHGQNTLVVLRDNRFVSLVYRDLGGIRISPHRLARYGIQMPPIRGGLVDDEPTVLRSTLFAAMISTVLSELITVVCREYGHAPDDLWSQVAATGRAVYRELPRSAGADARALFAEALPIKALTAMRLAGDPLAAIWAELPNPMSGLG